MKTELFISKSRLKHGDKYDYSNVLYTGSTNKVCIICKEHGGFLQTPSSHLSGKGCPKCSLNLKQNTKSFIEKCIKLHGYKYDYSKVNYISSRKNVTLICKKHGDFLKIPFNILQGQGCKKCSNSEKGYDVEVFLEKAKVIHDNKYNYSLVNYINTKTKISIICDKHGEFLQTPHLHLSGKGCFECGLKFGKLENKWLDNFNIEKKYRQFRIGRYIVDGYDPITNTVYEFNGDFWHGNPNRYASNELNNVVKKTFGELYIKTLEKEEKLKELGYNVISIWETDFLNEKVIS